MVTQQGRAHTDEASGYPFSPFWRAFSCAPTGLAELESGCLALPRPPLTAQDLQKRTETEHGGHGRTFSATLRGFESHPLPQVIGVGHW